MFKKFARKFSSIRMQLVFSVFVVIAPALIITYVVNQDWFWNFAPEWLKPYATDVPWVSFIIGLLALIAAWFGGEHFILHQVQALSDVAQRLTKGDFTARTGLKKAEGELGQLAKTFDVMAESLQQRINERENAEKLMLLRALQQTVVASLGQFALTNNDLPALMNHAVIFAAQTLEVEYSAVLERLPDSQLLLQAGIGWKEGSIGKAKVASDNLSQIGFTYNSGEPVITADSSAEMRFSKPALFLDHGVASGVTIAIPTPTHGQPFGVLGVFSTHPRKFTNDEVQFLLAVANAIGTAADRLNLEAQLRQAQKMESVGQLAAGVAHDFNNMLTIIQGHSSMMLARPGLPSDLLDSVQAVYFAAERAAGLTRQLLMFSRKNVMQPKSLDLRRIVGDMSKMLQRLIGETIDLRFQPPEELPFVHGDSGMIEQVVMNLAVNARDAMPNGGALTVNVETISVDADYMAMHPEAHAGNFVRLSVADTGCGMDSATMSKIFEPFFTTKEVGKGTGLGLATVYGIVKQHDGWVEVSSEPGTGSTFSVFFPASAEMATSQNEKIIPVLPVSGGTESILIVEDEPVLREMARDILASCGYQILEAASGREALDVWNRRASRIDLLLTDMVMPEGVSGVNLANQLLADQPGLKVIFTSGYTANEVNPEVLAKTHARFLQKPYAHSDLARTVRDCLDTKGIAETVTVAF